MRTDTIFYQLFQSYPSLLFELVGLPPETAQGYQFSSAEIKERSFRFDGIFCPNTPDKFIWFVEVQFQKVEEFYRQFITEIMFYLNQYAPVQDWRAVAIFPNRTTEPQRFLHYSELFASERVRAVYLNEIEAESPYLSLVKLIITPEEQVIEPARELVLKHREVSSLLEFVETILAYKLKNLTREEIAAMFTLGDLKQTRVYQDAYREALQVGETRGREEGKQEGRREGELRTILRILDRKFGTLPPQLVSQISALPIERLDDLADAVLDLQNLDELVRWLS
jgi:predicted transposase/invertase (TIGR01784 family)